MASIQQIYELHKPEFGGKFWKAHFDKWGKEYNNPVWELVDSETLVGIEVEVENAGGNQPTYLWQSKNDGSLRNGGIEYVSFPMRGENVGIALNHLFNFTMNKDKVFSTRTSIHVHVDVRELTPEEVLKITCLYCAVEPVLYEWVGKGRASSIFCVPWWKTHYINNVIRNLKTLEEHHGSVQNQTNRYSGLNFDSMMKFGTLEFRHLAGTDDVRRIVTWINILLQLKKAAIAANKDALLKQIEELNTKSNYATFVQEHFGMMGFHLQRVGDFEKLMELGVKTVKRSTANNLFSEQLKYVPTSPLGRVLKNLGLLASKTLIFDEIVPADPTWERTFAAALQRVRVDNRVRPAPPGLNAAPVRNEGTPIRNERPTF